jgi:outer membrane protein assembly factor BamD (BamD/ComL family)
MTRLRTNTPGWRTDPRHVVTVSATRVLAFLTDRWRWAVGAAVGLLVLSVVIAAYFYWSGRKDTDAATLLRKAVGQLDAITRNASDGAKQGEGLRLLHDVIHRYPGTAAAAEATLRLGTYYYTTGEYNEARTAYTAYLEQNPRGLIAFSAGLGVGDTYLAERNYDKAAETYSRLIGQFAQEPLLPEAQLHLAKAYLGMGRLKDASAIYEQIVATYPNTSWAQRAQAESYKAGQIPR